MVHIKPDWDGDVFHADDIAVIEFSSPIPLSVPRYGLYDGPPDGEFSVSEGIVVGYGRSGHGTTGMLPPDPPEIPGGTKRYGLIRWESTGLGDLGATAPTGFSENEELLTYDFDSGSAAEDGFGFFFGMPDSGFASEEVGGGIGDSGGPAFIDTGTGFKIAGVASYGTRLEFDSGGSVIVKESSGSTVMSSDLDSMFNGTWGEFFAHARVDNPDLRVFVNSIIGDAMTWDGAGPGVWESARWTGGLDPFPTSADTAEIVSDTVFVTGFQSVAETTVSSGGLHVSTGAALKSASVTVASGASLSGGGWIDGSVTNSGIHTLEAAEGVFVVGSGTLSSTDLELGAGYTQARGTETGLFDVLTAPGGITGTFATPAGTHLGSGHFLRTISHTTTKVTVNILAAKKGDADGDKDVDITDFNNLSANFDPVGVNSATNDWTSADFDGDDDVDITDFNDLSANFAPSGYGTKLRLVPEPTTIVLCLLGLISVGTFVRGTR